MTDIFKILKLSGLIPVVVIENADDAVPTAKALLSGGVSVMEITFRTEAAAEAIKRVSSECPEMLVGAGTVITLEQAKLAVNSGARFLVMPGFSEDVVSWCSKNEIPVVPGCVTPSEIISALRYNINVVKFFPANVYGGLSAMKALAGPFGNVKFIPTGGINSANIGEYISSTYIFAVGGSWVCSKADIANRNFDKITSLCLDAVRIICESRPAD